MVDEGLIKLKENRLLVNKEQMIDYMLTLEKVENSVKKVEYIPYLVAGIDNATHERDIVAGAVTAIEDIIADNDVSLESVLVFLNASLPEYETKFEFLDEIYFALLNYCEKDNVLADCYKSLTIDNQEKLQSVLKELEKEDKHRYSKIIEDIIQ